MKKISILLAVSIALFLLAGCQSDAPIGTGLTDTASTAESAATSEATQPTEPSTIMEMEQTDPYADLFPVFDDPNWELAYASLGIYRYTGDMDQIDLAGYTLSIPESWRDKVTVYRNDPAGEDCWVYVTVDSLRDAFAENTGIGAEGELWDYLIKIIRAPKSEEGMGPGVYPINQWREYVEQGTAIVAGEDDEMVYFASVHDKNVWQGYFIREDLIDHIGQEAYDELMNGLDCALEEAAAMISVG